MSEQQLRLPPWLLLTALAVVAAIGVVAVSSAQPEPASECCPCAAEVSYAADLSALRVQDRHSFLDITTEERAALTALGSSGSFGTDRRNATIRAATRVWRCLRLQGVASPQ